MAAFLAYISGFVYGPVLLVVLIAMGVYLSLRTGFVQVRLFRSAWREAAGALREVARVHPKRLSPFQAALLAMGGTIGSGSIVGVTAAIAVGGPGAIFWMWLVAFFGMATKFTEVTLGLHFRRVFQDGSVTGGPMAYLSYGLGIPWLGMVFGFFIALSSLATGNLPQISSISQALQSGLGVPGGIGGIVAALLLGTVLFLGVKTIARISTILVPLMVVLYGFVAILIIIDNISALPAAIASIFTYAFNPAAALGGAAAYTWIAMLSEGVGRGIYSNEAGLGSAAIAHAQANVDHPVRQGMWGIIEVFLVTFIISTLTALVVLTSGQYTQAWPDNFDLALASFSGFPWGDKLFAISLILFSFTTLLTWSFYGEEGIAVCFGDWIRVPFRVIYGVTALLGAVGSAGLFLDMAGIFDGVTILLNLFALAILGFAVTPRLVIGFLRGEAWHHPTQTQRSRTRH